MSKSFDPHGIHLANIRCADTRRKAFARYHAYLRMARNDAQKAELGSELVSTLHRIDARNASR